jgi:hypothetical protein
MKVQQLRLDLVGRQEGHDLGRSDPLPGVAKTTPELFSALNEKTFLTFYDNYFRIVINYCLSLRITSSQVECLLAKL